MRQLRLFEIPGPKPIVNVASVPKRSPFRYPGGKTWLVPEIRTWLLSRPERPVTLYEPFAGGGIVGLTAVFEDLVEKSVLVELDPDVAAVWKTILNGNAQWLAQRILEFDLTPQNVDTLLAAPIDDVCQRAFRTIVRNRISHGGILAPGGGVLKNGENGRGLKSRWYPLTLAKRILAIGERRDRISILEEDGIAVIKASAFDPDGVFFIDPPYTAAGKKAGSRLYTFCELDHESLFTACEEICGDFLMTYDNALDVQSMAFKHGFDCEAIAMKNTHHAEMKELLIGSDLTWARC